MNIGHTTLVYSTCGPRSRALAAAGLATKNRARGSYVVSIVRTFNLVAP